MYRERGVAPPHPRCARGDGEWHGTVGTLLMFNFQAAFQYTAQSKHRHSRAGGNPFQN